MTSWASYGLVVRTAFSESRSDDPFNDLLGLIDVDFLIACENTNFRHNLSRVGTRLSTAHGQFLGEGGTFMVRRIPYSAGEHLVAGFRDANMHPRPDFVVLKQQVLPPEEQIGPKGSDIHRLRAAMLEMKILRHQPIYDHPNIIKLLQTRWDFQDDFNLTLPSIVMEYGDFGTLSDFQDPDILTLTANTKKDICLDIAKGLQFLHDCGVIHGDIKPENILICKHPKHEGAYLAKISDLGSSLLEVGVGLQTEGLRRITKGTPGWRAPDQMNGGPLDHAGLCGVDMYSYGLLVWSVMLNGTNPWKAFVRTQPGTLLYQIGSQKSHETGEKLSASDFDTLKQTDEGEKVYQLASQCFEGGRPWDVDVDAACRILQLTLQSEPKSHATDFNEIFAVLEGRGDSLRNSDLTADITPTMLKHGDFYLDSPWLPWQMFTLNTCPLPFRRVIYLEMIRVMSKLEDSDQRKAQLRLCLAICHYQRFAPNPNMEYAAELVYQAAKAGNKKAQQMCQSCFHHCGIPGPAEIDAWLQDGVRRGSFLARNTLAKSSSTMLHSMEDQIMGERQRLGDRWIRSVRKHGVNWLVSDQATTDGLDEVFQFFAERDGVTSLHKAALTGNFRLVQTVISHGAESSATNSHGETPLHYAALSGSLTTIQAVDPTMSTVNFQSNLKATPLHYAILGSASTEVLEFFCKSGADLTIPSDYMDPLQHLIFSDYYFRLSGTPLVWATVIDNFEAVFTLLGKGADPFRGQVTSSDLPAWCVAFSNRSLGIIQLLFATWLVEKFNREPPAFDEIVPLLGSQMTTPLRLVLHGDESIKDFVLAVLELDIWEHHPIDKALVIIECLDFQFFHEDVVDIVEAIVTEKCFKPGTEYGLCRYRSFGTTNYTAYHVSLESFLSLAIGSNSIDVVRMLFRYIGPLKTTFMPPLPYFELAPPLTPEKTTFFELLTRSRVWTEHEIGDLVECLLAHGADRSAKSRTTWSVGSVTHIDPLESAASDLRVEIVKVYLDNQIGNVWGALARAVRDANSLLALRVMSAVLERNQDILLATIPPSGLDLNAADIGSLFAEPEQNGLHACLTILCNQSELDRSDAIAEKKVRMIENALQSLPEGRVAMSEVVQSRDFGGSTLLHHAAANGNIRLCEFLLSSGADINASTAQLAFDLSGLDFSSLELPDIAPVASTSSSDVEHLHQPLLPFKFEPPKGRTPLDNALQRDWFETIQRPKYFKEEMMAMHRTSGDHKQRKDFEKRKDDVVTFLRERGGKSSSDL